MLRSLIPLTAAGLLSACIATPRPVIMPDRVLGPRDSLALAFETGRRDAMVLHPERFPLFVLVPPTALLIALQTDELWALPVTTTVLHGGLTFQAYRETRAPFPAPPDSMRTRYALDSDEAWRRYRLGFQSAIEDRRDRNLSRTLRGWLISGSLWILYFAVRPPR